MQQFYFDIEVTKQCNFSCKYCYEYHHCKANKSGHISKDLLDTIIETISKLQTTRLKETEVTVVLWGGEPTLIPQHFLYLINRLSSDIRFLIITNGYHIPQDFIQATALMPHRIQWQISYDGEPIQSLYRKPNSRKAILQNLSCLLDIGANVSLKPTLPIDAFKYLYDAYLDFNEIFQDYSLKFSLYNPTIDHWVRDIEEIYLKDLEESLKKIIKYDLKRKQTTFFPFVEQRKPLCSAGFGILSFSMDGYVYPCHGAFFSDVKDHRLCEADELLDKFDSIVTFYRNAYNKAMNSCDDCKLQTCRRCYVTAYRYSDKTNYIDKWTDFTSQPVICKVYTLLNAAKLAYQTLLENKEST